MALSEGTYDCLYIGNKLQSKIGDFSEGELQLFAYLACLLALYDGQDVSSWGYLFIKNENGSPYSNDVSNSMGFLAEAEFLNDSDKDNYYTITTEGAFLLAQLASHSGNLFREKYLKAAVLMVDFFPYGLLTKAINEEPILRLSRSVNARRNLLDSDGSGHALLYQQFSILKEAISEESKELIMPAYLWVNSLAFYKPKLSVANE
ncbi:hypothetical protein L0P88_10235 [Muricauda sp. SCSIO 64092]|uniref:hypothetical protein n=1 Tax=Allomuricauda sp. SCSIO 64092 TaxID=2908842 RepID=UPI001FF2DF67|nr:hypothetical protein [Muricauda sp. SCSIO 64092]UOY08911.1 hypothetical protein L0P88_10235 [Muricauda sp. SCSIO 64092]